MLLRAVEAEGSCGSMRSKNIIPELYREPVAEL